MAEFCFCTKRFGRAGESHPLWIHALQDAAAEKLNDLSGAGAGAMAFEQNGQLQLLCNSEQEFSITISAFAGGWLALLLDGGLRKGLVG